MNWLRWYHGTVTDPKWRVIAKRAGCTVADVIAVWATMLEAASQRTQPNATERGELFGWCAEDVSALLDIDEAQIEKIQAAMQGKVLDGKKLTGWSRRQPKREDGSADRAKAWREKKKLVAEARSESSEKDENATERNRTQPNARVEESRRELTTMGIANANPPSVREFVKRAKQLPDGWTPSTSHRGLAGTLGVDADDEAERFRDFHTAKGSVMKDWEAAFRTWLRNANRFASRDGRSAERPSLDAGVWG